MIVFFVGLSQVVLWIIVRSQDFMDKKKGVIFRGEY